MEGRKDLVHEVNPRMPAGLEGIQDVVLSTRPPPSALSWRISKMDAFRAARLRIKSVPSPIHECLILKFIQETLMKVSRNKKEGVKKQSGGSEGGEDWA